jgi:hypothetical protein
MILLTAITSQGPRLAAKTSSEALNHTEFGSLVSAGVHYTTF